MKNIKVKHALCATSLLLAAAYSGGAPAHQWPGFITNNTLSGSTEGWQVMCWDPATAGVYFGIKYLLAIGNPSNPGRIIGTISKEGYGRSVSDANPSTTAPGAATVAILGGVGTYFVTVHRTNVGAAEYRIYAYCVTGSGAEAQVPPLTAVQVINN